MVGRFPVPLFRTMAPLIVTIGSLFLPVCQSRCFAVANPVKVSLPVWYRNAANGPNIQTSYAVTVTATDGWWQPQNTGWNAKNTAANNKIENVISPAGFPFMSGKDNVTTDSCKFYWDAKLPAWTYVSAASCSTNCYAYSTGKDYWVQPSGFNQIMLDEYAIFSTGWCSTTALSSQAAIMPRRWRRAVAVRRIR